MKTISGHTFTDIQFPSWSTSTVPTARDFGTFHQPYCQILWCMVTILKLRI